MRCKICHKTFHSSNLEDVCTGCIKSQNPLMSNVLDLQEHKERRKKKKEAKIYGMILARISHLTKEEDE